jgi:putative ABC transport system permease protein
MAHRSGGHRGRSRPPRWAERFLAFLLPWQYRDEHLGDLQEGFERRRTEGPSAANWYRRQVLRSIPGALRLRFQTRHDGTPQGHSMETVGQDIRFAIRSLIKSPGFAIVSTVTLALAIGVNTSIFSLVSAIVFADLPMQNSETASAVRTVNAELEIDQGSVSPADYLDLVERSRSFESLSALTEAGWVMTGGDQPMRVTGLNVTAGLFETWQLPPALGRGFAEGEDRWGAVRVAMLSHGFWQERFSGDPDVLGTTLLLDGEQYTVVGVAHPNLEFASFANTQVITPLILDRSEPNRAIRYLFVVGRTAPGVTQAMATEEVRRIGEDLANEYPEQNRGWGLWSAPVMESLLNEEANVILLLLQLTVAMVILIACANVANMLLARATARAREIAVRAALGAGRRRLVRQLLTESLMISLAAAGMGVGIAWMLNRALIWVSAGTEEVFLMSKLDGRVLAFTLLVSLVAPMVFGLFPALRASAPGASSALRDGRSGDGGRSGKRARSALVTAQVSLALTLMIVATLLTRTVLYMGSQPLGFDASDVVTVRVGLPEGGRYTEDGAPARFFEQAREAMAQVGGFSGVEITSTLPAAEFGALRSLDVEGLDLPEGRAAPTALFTTVSEGYFSLLGLEITSGRGLEDTDHATSFPVAVVSRQAADAFWPGEDPVGRRIRVAGSDDWMQVVGVVGDVRTTNNSDEPSQNIYIPHAQDARYSMVLLGRNARDPGVLAGPIREAIWSVDPDLPVGAVRTLERSQYEANASGIAIAMLFVTFAVFALIMAAVGIYGVMAYSVSQRQAEIGLRMALGAETGTVRLMVVRQGLRLLAMGVAIGMVASYGLSRLLQNIMFGISANDPLTFVGVPIVLGLVAMIANMIPAMRATRMDPAATLRGS